jgi:predicted membrane protein
MALWVPISATLFRRAVLMLWHAFLFLGLLFFPSFLLFAWWPPLLFLVRNYCIHKKKEKRSNETGARKDKWLCIVLPFKLPYP